MKRIIALVLTAALVMSSGITGAFAAGNPQQRDSGATDSGYAVTVTNGSTDKETAKKGETVTITADDHSEQKEKFLKWTSNDNVKFNNENSATTSFTMIDKAVTVNATYEPTAPTTYNLTVKGGSSSGSVSGNLPVAADGELITITANTPVAGKVFNMWTTESKGVIFADKNAPVTTFTMPANHAIVTANYKDKTVNYDGLIGVGYPNTDRYVSIDTKDTAKASDYFTMILRNNNGSWNNKDSITAIELVAGGNPAFKDILEIKGFDPKNADDGEIPARFAINAGKTLAEGVYNVPMTATIKMSDGKIATKGFAVELHVNATDPAYIKTSEAFFDIADLNAPAATLTSGTITVASPSGKQIYSVTAADKMYTAVNGKWDAAKKEYTFQLQAKADKDGKYNFSSDTGVLVSFTPPKARMVSTPALVETVVRTSDTKIATYGKIAYTNPLAKYNSTAVEFKLDESKPLPDKTHIDQIHSEILNFISTPAEALYDDSSSINAREIGSATFDFDAGLDVYGLFKVSAHNLLWNTKGHKITATDEVIADGKAYAYITSNNNSIDINKLDTYTVTFTAYAHDKDYKRLDITKVELLSESDSKYFGTPSALKKSENGEYTFTITLKNEKAVLPQYNFGLNFKVTTAQGVFNSDGHITWKAGEPTAVYFTKDGKKIGKDTLAVGAAGTKYGVKIEDYAMVDGDVLKLDGYDRQILSIVRGDRFYSDMGTTEQVTVRADSAVAADKSVSLGGSLNYTPKITNKAVMLTLPKKFSSTFSLENIKFTTTGGDPVVPPVTPPVTPPSNNNNGDSNSGSGSTGGNVTNPDKPSANVGSDGKVDSKEAVKEVTSAVADAVKTTANKTANVTIKNAEAITPAALKEIAAAAAKAGGSVVLQADSVVDGKIEARLYIDPKLAANIKADIKLGVSLSESSTAATKAKFKNFDNKMAVASFAQQGSFGMKVPVAIKADLTGLNTKTLVFYSYNKATNKYIPIANTGYYIDKNGFLHFNTTVGGEIIITDKPLVKKK